MSIYRNFYCSLSYRHMFDIDGSPSPAYQFTNIQEHHHRNLQITILIDGIVITPLLLLLTFFLFIYTIFIEGNTFSFES